MDLPVSVADLGEPRDRRELLPQRLHVAAIDELLGWHEGQNPVPAR